MLTGTDSLMLGDFNVHHSLWHSGTTNTRGNQLANSVSTSSFAVLNTDSPIRLPGNSDPSSPDVSLASTAENERITFTGRPQTSPKLIANSSNRQFTTSKLCKHYSSRRTRHVSKDVKRMSLEEAETFTSDQVTSAIKSCRSNRSYGPDSLSIFHLKNLGPLATEHLTTLYNDSLKSFRLPSIWKTSLIIPIPKPGKDSSQGTSYRPISLLCPAAKVLEALILPSINEFLSPAKDQNGFRPRHSTSSALLQLSTDIETGFNQWKPHHRTVRVAIDLTAAFATVSHDTLISKTAGSSMPPAITRWLSCYLRERQTAIILRGTKSSTRIVRTGVNTDMPRPTTPVKKVYYAEDITVWATGPKIPQLESMINSYLREVSIYLKDNSLLISAPKSTVTLFTPDKHQFQILLLKTHSYHWSTVLKYWE